MLLFALLLAGDPALPDHTRTPGAVNPAVTQANIHETICVPGWTRTVRPPSSYTNRLKRQQIKAWRLKDKNPAHFEEDHLVALSSGGHPTDPRNLWPQSYAARCGARIKDMLELHLQRKVCAGEITLVEAQKALASDWIAAYKLYVHPEGCPVPEDEQ